MNFEDDVCLSATGLRQMRITRLWAFRALLRPGRVCACAWPELRLEPGKWIYFKPTSAAISFPSARGFQFIFLFAPKIRKV